jgi:D-glycero-beta-D-manno-heptose-7-phosphate kinase
MQKDIDYSKYVEMDRKRIEEIMTDFSKIKILVVGDGCLDIYWEADMTKSELSRETPHYPLPIIEERISLGGAANVANNLAAVGVKSVDLLTVIGCDWRGREFQKLLQEKSIKTEGLITDSERYTPAYCKPIRHGLSEVSYEDPRIDFLNKEYISGITEEEFLNRLSSLSSKTDALVIIDQLPGGVITDQVKEELIAIGKDKLAVADSRTGIDSFKNIIVKPNQIEVMKAVNYENNDSGNLSDWLEAGNKLTKLTEAPVVITLGSKGAVWINQKKAIEVPILPAREPVDIVGAGDCFMAAFVTALAVGALPEEAIFVANLAAAVSVKKLRITGSATREEILAKYDEIYGG